MYINTTACNAIDPTKIGLKSYSFGGPSILGVAGGSQVLGISADPRVKALFIMDGGPLYSSSSNPSGTKIAGTFPGITTSDVANIHVPVLEIFNDGVAPQNNLRLFQDLSSHDVTMVRLSNYAHIATGGPWCNTVQATLDNLNTETPLDRFVVPLYNLSIYTGDPYSVCPASIFTTQSVAAAKSILFGSVPFRTLPPVLGLNPPAGNTPSIYTMPLRMLDSELLRIENFYAVAFFEANLAGDNNGSDHYLTANYANNHLPPFVKTWHNQYQVPDQPLDLQPGDKITFMPMMGNLYQVSYSQGNQMVPVDNTHTVLTLADDGQAIVAFSAGFPFLGTTFGNSSIISPWLSGVLHTSTPINNIDVNANGNITLGVDVPAGIVSRINAINAFSDDNLISSGVYRIAPFFADLVPSNPNSAVTYKETTDGRLIVTYTNVPRYPYDAINLNLGPAVANGNSTFQVILYGTTSSSPGEIDFIYCHLDPVTNNPDRIVATVGIAKGDAWANYPIVPIGSKMGTTVDFTALKKQPLVLPVGAIYEVFTNGITINK